MIKIVYLDEEAGWQSTVYAVLSSKYEVHIPESLPHDVSQIWDEICDSQLAIVDFRLNGDGKLSYTGDDVAREIHKHNKHMPIFIITSFEDNAIQECTEIQFIRGKELFTDPKQESKLFNMIDSAVSIYERRKADCEYYIAYCQEKFAKGEPLTTKEEADKFDAELYISELDLDSSARSNLITTSSSKELEELLSLARTIVANHKK